MQTKKLIITFTILLAGVVLLALGAKMWLKANGYDKRDVGDTVAMSEFEVEKNTLIVTPAEERVYRFGALTYTPDAKKDTVKETVTEEAKDSAKNGAFFVIDQGSEG